MDEPTDLESIINEFDKKNVLVVGDIMLDSYVFGNIERISPEAPVPVLSQVSEKQTLGGAANVAENLCKLANKVYLVGVIGNDESGIVVKNLMVRDGIDRTAVMLDTERHTTLKTRLIAQNQQIARIDKEKKHSLNEVMEKKMLDSIHSIINDIDAIVLSDYAKGVLTPNLCSEVIKMANEKRIPVIVDPKDSLMKFKSATLIKPNLKELSAITKIDIKSFDDMERAVRHVFDETSARIVLVTKGKMGMTVFVRNLNNDSLEKSQIDAICDEVYDITGAGDTVTALLALSLSITDNAHAAAKIANYGAGVVVRKLGTATVSKDELFSIMNKKNNKIKTREEIVSIVDDLKKKGKVVVSTNGSFDILHAGHVYFLKEAKKQGDVLIVGLNSDSSVREWKKLIGYKDWEKRPVVPQYARAEMLSALEAVDYVTIFEEPDCLQFVESVKPHVHVNGSEYGKDCIEAETVKKYGGTIHIVEKIPGMSTSELIQKIKDAYKN